MTDPGDECGCDDCKESGDDCKRDCDGEYGWYCQGCKEAKDEMREREAVYLQTSGLAAMAGKQVGEL